MTTPEAKPKPLATSDQASALLREAGALVTLSGNGKSFELDSALVPPEVVAHFPVSEPTSLTERDSVYVSQSLDPSTGRPRQEGTIAVVSFTRTEQLDDHLGYVTQVDYVVNAADERTFKGQAQTR